MMSTPQSSALPMIVLVPGHWLGSWAWDDVLTHLRTAGLRVVALTLPGLDGQDPRRASRTLDEQAAAVQAVVDPEPDGVVLVAHSGANAPVSIVIDRTPELIRHVVWVDSGPVAPGNVFAPELSESVEELPLPSFDVLGEQASLEGLSADDLDRFRAKAVPEPGPVLRAAVQLTNDARLGVPTTLVCCSITSTRVLELAHAGHPMFTEVARLEHVETIDLPTGHWPMWSRSMDLAETIRNAALGSV